MTPDYFITIFIPALALIISLFTAYRTFMANFSGRIWFSNRIVLTHVDNIPSLGLACFFENKGARPGILDDLRAKIDPKDSGTTYYFYPILFRNDYSIFKSYSESDWFPFSLIPLPPNYRSEKYILLKPMNDNFTCTQGELEISLEVRWYGKDKWVTVVPVLTFLLSQEIAEKWNDPKSASIQITSLEILTQRKK
jgi:hypothetical protein